MRLGEQSVMHSGPTTMEMWLADNWDSPREVQPYMLATTSDTKFCKGYQPYIGSVIMHFLMHYILNFKNPLILQFKFFRFLPTCMLQCQSVRLCRCIGPNRFLLRPRCGSHPPWVSALYWSGADARSVFWWIHSWLQPPD